MFRAVRISLVCMLLAFVSVIAASGVRFSHDRLRREAAAARPVSEAKAAELTPASAIVEEGPDTASIEQEPVSPSVEEEPDTPRPTPALASSDEAGGQQGPILMPIHPAYASRPLETQPLEFADEPTTQETEESHQVAVEALQDPDLTQEATPEEAAKDADPPAQEQQPDETAGAAADEASEQTPPEEPAIEEPAIEGPAIEEPAIEEPAIEEPAIEEPAIEGPAIEEPVIEEPEPKRELTAAQAAQRDRVRKTLAFHHRQALSTRENTATELMHACLAFGCSTEVYRGTSTREKVNGITCLCWNYPCAGYTPLVVSQGRIAARIGYGLQEHPSQLLSVLALARVQPTYPMRVGEDVVRTVADLVEHEKLSCRSGTDLSLKLIGLMYYAADEPVWTNALGEAWSIERIIREELTRPVITAADGGMNRLMGLSYAVYRRAKRGEPIDGQFLRARTFLEDFHGYAFSLQNSDGSWGPHLLAAKGASRDTATQLRSTGHVLQWLALSLPEDRLDDPRVVRAVDRVVSLLGSSRYRNSVKTYSTREIGAVMHALHALMLYDERFFMPADPIPEPPQSPGTTAQAAG